MYLGHALAMFCLLCGAEAPTHPMLPKDWQGVWLGELTVYGPAGKVFQRPWELHVEPLTNGRGFTWRIISSMAGKKSVREYELIPDPDKADQFTIDEKNGIVLNARLMGHTLYSYYKDGDILISTRF